MLRKFLIFIGLIVNCNSFVINPLVYNSHSHVLTNEHGIKIDTHTHTRTAKRTSMITLLNSNLPPPPESPMSPTLVDHLLDVTIKDKYLGKLIVEKISALLPKVDTIGHSVLHANNEFIDYILNDTNLSEMMKKNIVLTSIKLAIMGDNMGSTLLQLYYDIVDKCL